MMISIVFSDHVVSHLFDCHASITYLHNILLFFQCLFVHTHQSVSFDTQQFISNYADAILILSIKLCLRFHFYCRFFHFAVELLNHFLDWVSFNFFNLYLFDDCHLLKFFYNGQFLIYSIILFLPFVFGFKKFANALETRNDILKLQVDIFSWTTIFLSSSSLISC